MSPCIVCQQENCYVHCQVHETHEPDLTSADSREGTLTRDGQLIIDFNCKHCGLQGATSIEPSTMRDEALFSRTEGPGLTPGAYLADQPLCGVQEEVFEAPRMR